MLGDLRACVSTGDWTDDACANAYNAGVAKGCAPAHVDAFSAFVASGGSFTCQAGPFGGRDLYPVSNDEAVAIGMLCPLTLSHPDCAGISCEYNADCPGDDNCNDRIGRCVATNAACPGLPCTYDADCGAGQVCNSALQTCIFN
jgi:hypothetical protein